MTAVQQEVSQLVDLVRRFRVCWEVWPEEARVGTERRRIGFAIELSGTHEEGGGHPGPGCHRCKEIFAALHEIAEHILPREERPSCYEIGLYDSALHYSPIRKNRPDVSLTVRINHRHRISDPVDGCQVQCLREMTQRLKQLGAPERQWALIKGGQS